MKKLIVLLCSLYICFAYSQDIIITNDAQKIDARILEVSKYEIKYKELDNLEGPTFILEVSDISSIIYSNGKVVLYNVSDNNSLKHYQEHSIIDISNDNDVMIFSLNENIASKFAYKTNDRLVVENWCNEANYYTIFIQYFDSEDWYLLTTTGKLSPHKDCIKYSTFRDRYWDYQYKSDFEIYEITQNDNNIRKIAIKAGNLNRIRSEFFHQRSDLIIKIYDEDSPNGVLPDN